MGNHLRQVREVGSVLHELQPEIVIHGAFEVFVQTAAPLPDAPPPERGRLRDEIVNPKQDVEIEFDFTLRLDEAALSVNDAFRPGTGGFRGVSKTHYQFRFEVKFLTRRAQIQVDPIAPVIQLVYMHLYKGFRKY